MAQSYAIVLSVFLLANVAASQQSTSSNPLAQQAISQSVAAMGGSAPTDSTASGTVKITAGSTSQSASFSITTRGILQSREVIKAANATQDHVFSLGQASTVSSGTVAPVSMEQGSSFQSSFFPLLLLQAALSNPDSIFQYVGLETLAGRSTVHVRLWNSYASQAKLFQSLATFSAKDVWLDATTYLPRRIGFDSRAASGAAPTVHVDLDFSTFQSFNGILYPNAITESLNGTIWGTFSVQSVVFNTGLSDSDFPVQ